MYRGVTRLNVSLFFLLIFFMREIKEDDINYNYIHMYVFALYRHHQHGRWQARIGRVAGNKDLYLGTFSKWSNPSSSSL